MAARQFPPRGCLASLTYTWELGLGPAPKLRPNMTRKRGKTKIFTPLAPVGRPAVWPRFWAGAPGLTVQELHFSSCHPRGPQSWWPSFQVIPFSSREPPLSLSLPRETSRSRWTKGKLCRVALGTMRRSGGPGQFPRGVSRSCWILLFISPACIVLLPIGPWNFRIFELLGPAMSS